MVADESYYKALGVDINAGVPEIRRRYKELAIKWHPDKLGRETEEFRLIARAHSTLTEPTKRMKYDLYGPSLKPSAGDEMGDGIASIVPVFGGFAFGAVPALAIAAGAVHWVVGLLLLVAAFYGARAACVSSEAEDKVSLLNRAFGVAVGLFLGPHTAMALIA